MQKKFILVFLTFLICVGLVIFAGLVGSNLFVDLSTHKFQKPVEKLPQEYFLTVECLVDGNLMQNTISFFASNAKDEITTNMEIKNHMRQVCNKCDEGSECIFISTNAMHKTTKLVSGLKWDFENNNFFDEKNKPILEMNEIEIIK